MARKLVSDDYNKIPYSDVELKFDAFMGVLEKRKEISFPLELLKNKTKKHWLTKGIRKSCLHMRQLIAFCRGVDNEILNRFQKKYCYILKKVIAKARDLLLEKEIISSDDKIEKTWEIISREIKEDTRSKNL
ncbi:hypothetical protein JTB14_033766 [Gonioctena quinquepunctata]|nr:hypothetical protein JTB14_033766 [Gonioctena quinquepunctata]